MTLRRSWKIAALCLGTTLTLLSVRWQVGYAQTFTEEEIASYAAAVLQMEDARQQTYSEISDLLTSEQLDVTTFDLTCTAAEQLDMPRSVRGQAKKMLITYCNDALALVETNGLTAEQFDRITAAHDQDETLFEQIQSEIRALQ